MRPRFYFFYRFRGVLMAPPVILALISVWGESELEALTWGLGLALFALGVAGRIWAQMHLHYRLRMRKTLTTTGPYQYVRNPIYISNTLMLLGLTCISELLWLTPVMLAWCAVVYHFVVRHEEAHLTDKYGVAYVEFLGRVPRWRPRRSEGALARVSVYRFLGPSLLAEADCLLLLFPFIVKELMG